MDTILAEFKSSDLSRKPLEVFLAAENSPVRVTRRDGTDMILMTQREADARAELLGFAAQLIAVSTDDRGSLAERLADKLPWILALNPTDQVQCAKDLINAARASFATNQPFLAVAELTAWRETATAIASGVSQQRVTWLEE